MPKIKVNDINMYYEVYGSGEPIVFISGFTADHTKWMSVVNKFARDYQVIIFDNRGAGQSDCPAYPYSVGMMADDTAKLCENLSINSAHFIGSSMGGAIVQTIAYKFPKLVKTAVISNSAMKFNVKLKLACEANLILRQAKVPVEAILKRALCDLFSVDFLSREGVVDSLLKIFAGNPYPMTDQGYVSQMHAVLEFDSRSWANKINQPSLVIYSDEDPIVELDSFKALIAAIPKAEGFCFNKVGHCPDVEQPDVFVKVVKEFIKKSA
jgi:pimeloyl-ACP methyl ester carboxylesterase